MRCQLHLLLCAEIYISTLLWVKFVLDVLHGVGCMCNHSGMWRSNCLGNCGDRGTSWCNCLKGYYPLAPPIDVSRQSLTISVAILIKWVCLVLSPAQASQPLLLSSLKQLGWALCYYQVGIYFHFHDVLLSQIKKMWFSNQEFWCLNGVTNRKN